MATLAPPEKPTTPPELRRELIVNLAINLIAPAALFYGLRALGVNQWLALLAGVVPPAVRAVQTVITKRRVDTLAVFTLSILVLSVATSFLSGSPRFLLAKDGWMTAAAGLWMLATLLRTPFLYQVLRSFLGQAARERMERNWLGSPTYRHVLRVTTAMWGVVLVLDAGVRMVLAYALPVDRVPLISGLQYVAVYLALEVATRVYARRKSVAAAIAAEVGEESLP
ncbi:VC0807 family protein [Amycolatopsis sp. NPDC047767]|uniref:VC0807 family protein n=1 Tax=Amycolatopsis sp. NPDC047767 TaxID=3156765 RepID=UPI003451A398